MIKFLGLNSITELSKKEEISFSSLTYLFIKLFPSIIIILIISFILSFINFNILKNNKIEIGELYKSEITISNFTILNPEDPYFTDINSTLIQPVNVNALLRNLSTQSFLLTDTELFEKFKEFSSLTFTKPDFKMNNIVDINFSLYSNSEDIEELKDKFINYLNDFSLDQLEILFNNKITQEQFQINSLQKKFNELKDIAEKDMLSRLSKRIEIYEDVKQKVYLENKNLENDVRIKKAEFISNFLNYLPDSETKEFLKKTDIYSLANFFNLNDPEVNLSFLTELNSAAVQENPFLEIRINAGIEDRINDKTLKLDILNLYYDRAKSKDKNLLYFDNISSETQLNSLSFQQLAVIYLIISFLLSIFIFYITLLVFYINKNNS